MRQCDAWRCLLSRLGRHLLVRRNLYPRNTIFSISNVDSKQFRARTATGREIARALLQLQPPGGQSSQLYEGHLRHPEHGLQQLGLSYIAEKFARSPVSGAFKEPGIKGSLTSPRDTPNREKRGSSISASKSCVKLYRVNMDTEPAPVGKIRT